MVSIFAFYSPLRKIQSELRFLVLCLFVLPVFAQGNYEIQVYGANTVEPGNTMVELHNNFTIEGSKTTTDGTYPTEHQRVWSSRRT